MAKRLSWTLDNKFELIKVYEKSGLSKAAFARTNKIPRSTFNMILSSKERLEKALLVQNGSKRKKLRLSKYKQVEEELVKWLAIARADNVPISGLVLKEKAVELARLSNIPDFTASNGWIERFKGRNGLTFKKVCGEAVLVNAKKVQERENSSALKGNETNGDKPGASKKKRKPKPKKPADSKSTYIYKNAEANPVDIPPLPSSPAPDEELVLVGKRTLDVNYFVECLRRVNRHHAAMQCSISDMIICDEQLKGNQSGIVFRCKVCLFNNTIWLDDAIPMETTTAMGQVNKNSSDDQISLPKLNIPRKPGGDLPVQSPTPVIVQSHVPLFGCPQVAPMEQTSSSNGASSIFADSPLVEMKFCVEEQPVQQEKTSGKWTPPTKKSRASPRIALTPRMISKRHAEYLSSKSTATPSKRPSSSAPSQLSNSDPGRITLPAASILQTHLEGTSTADPPKTIVLAPGNLQNISSLFRLLPGQGTTTGSVPHRILVPQIQSVQSVSQTSRASRSILLPPSVTASSSQSTSVQSAGSVPETITPDFNVLPVNLNLVKKEKNGTETFQPSKTLPPSGALPVDLNLVKKEVE